MFLGDRIRKRRLELNMTQEELGNLMGISKVAICTYENNTRTPKLDTIRKMSEVLKIDFSYLLGQDVSVVSEDTKLTFKIPKEDLKILSELKEYPKLYAALRNDPKRMVKLINNKLK